MSTPVHEQAAAWFARREAMAQHPLLQTQFEQWLAADPRHAEAWQQVQALWASPAFAQALSALPQRAARPRRRAGRLALAASVLLALAVGWWGDLPLRLEADQFTATGEQRPLQLSDGSRLILGPNSALRSDFSGAVRRIELLRGEVYIEAAHDTQHPMQVQAGVATVTVVGTRFAVSERSNAVTVAVREGRVQVSTPAGEASLLQAGNWVTLSGQQLQPLNAQGAERQLAWLDGRLAFQDMPLAAVLEELRRYYRPPVLLFNTAAGAQRVSGSYRLDDPQAIAEALAQVAQLQVTHLPGGALILH